MEEEDRPQGHAKQRQYVIDYLIFYTALSYMWCQSMDGRSGANWTFAVITDPEDSRFDLEAYLKMKAGEN